MSQALRGRDVGVSSAGLGAMVGHAIEPTAQALLLEHGFDGSGHRARQVDNSLLSAADLILVMERGHLKRIFEQSPQASGKAFLLGKWQSDREIPDPYRQQRQAFEHVYRLIEDDVERWLRYI